MQIMTVEDSTMKAPHTTFKEIIALDFALEIRGYAVGTDIYWAKDISI